MTGIFLPYLGFIAIVVLLLVPSKYLGAGSLGLVFTILSVNLMHLGATALSDWQTWLSLVFGVGCLASWAVEQLKEERNDNAKGPDNDDT